MKNDKIDLKEAFMPVTADLQARVELAFEKGEMKMKKQHKIMSLLSAAAVFAVVFAVGGLAVNEMYEPRTDHIALSAATVTPALPSTMPETPQQHAASKAQDIIFEPDFAHVDPSDPDALETLLNMAYRDYCELNRIETDSQWVDVHALNRLRAIPEEYGEDKEKWIEPIRDVLKGYLGFDLEYTAKNYLMNYVIACLSMQPDVEYNVEYNIESVSERIWNENLENYLTETYVRFCEVNGMKVYAGVLYRTVGALLDIPMKYGADEALWAQPIAMCLQDEMGLTADYIEQWSMIDEIAFFLRTSDGESAPEETTERVAVEITDADAPQIEGAYHFVEPAELP